MSSYIQKGWVSKFFQSPNCIFDVEELSSNEKLCYLYLCRCADGKLESFPSYTTIGQKMGVNRSTAIRVIKSLETKGYLDVKRRKKSRTENLPNVYTIVHPDEVKVVASCNQGSGIMQPGVVAPCNQGSGTMPPNKYPTKNTNLINTKQQTEDVVVVQDKIDKKFGKKINQKNSAKLIELAKEHNVDLDEKIENTYEYHTKVSPVKNVFGSIKYAIENGDWEITSPTPAKKSKLPRSMAATAEDNEVPIYDEQEIEIRRKRIAEKMAILYSNRNDTCGVGVQL